MELFKFLLRERTATIAATDTQEKLAANAGTFAHGYFAALHALEEALGPELTPLLDTLWQMKQRGTLVAAPTEAPVDNKEEQTEAAAVDWQRMGYVMRVRMLGTVALEETLRRHNMTHEQLPTPREVAEHLNRLCEIPHARYVFWVRDEDEVYTLAYYPDPGRLVRESCAQGLLYKVHRYG